MKEEIRTEIIYDIGGAIAILEQQENKNVEDLKTLSNHAIEDVALKKDLELVSVTVLLYSIYKTISCITAQSYAELLRQLKEAKISLEQRNLGRYNKSMKQLYAIIQRCDARVKEHLADVMQAARIKKGTLLLERGLSIGQAAGLMGLSNWDLQYYAGKSAALDQHDEKIPGSKRVAMALKLFGAA